MHFTTSQNNVWSNKFRPAHNLSIQFCTEWLFLASKWPWHSFIPHVIWPPSCFLLLVQTLTLLSLISWCRSQTLPQALMTTHDDYTLMITHVDHNPCHGLCVLHPFMSPFPFCRWSSILLVTNTFHQYRSLLLFKKALAELGMQCQVRRRRVCAQKYAYKYTRTNTRHCWPRHVVPGEEKACTEARIQTHTYKYKALLS